MMAYGIVHFFAGGTQEQYEASLAAVHPGDGRLPEGQIFHEPAHRPAAGRSSLFTIRRGVGSAFVTAP